MNARTAHRISLAAGIAVVLFSLCGLWVPAPPACGQLADNYAPIIAFEMARSVADLQAIFGAESNECRAAMRDHLDTVNWIDWLAYIPAYGAFLLFCLLGLSSRAPRLAMLAIRITVVACAADYIENRCLFALSAEPDIESPWLLLLLIFTEIKWIGLGVATALGGWIVAQAGRWRWAFIAPCSLGLIASLLSLAVPGLVGPHLSSAFALGWLALLIVDAHASFRKFEQQPTSVGPDESR